MEGVAALSFSRAVRAPIAKLPTEILAHVFVIYVECSLPAQVGHDPESSYLSAPTLDYSVFLSHLYVSTWNARSRNKSRSCNPRIYYALLLSHVCRYWRHLAQNLPPLWSHIILPNDNALILDILARSRSMIVSLKLSFESSPPPETVSLLRLHAHRFQSVIFEHIAEGDIASIDHLLGNAGNTQSLQLSMASWSLGSKRFTPLRQQFVNLRRLSLGGYSVTQMLPFLASSLSYLRLEPDVPLYMDDLLAAVQYTPFLKQLCIILRPVIDFTTKIASSSGPKTHLPRLQVFQIVLNTFLVETLFQRLSYPPTASTHIHTLSALYPASPSLSAFTGIINASPAEDLKVIAITQCNVMITIETWTCEIAMFLRHLPFIDYDYMPPRHHFALGQLELPVLLLLFTSFRLHHLECLYIACESTLHMSTIIPDEEMPFSLFCAQMPSLRVIRICGVSPVALLRVLKTNDEDANTSGGFLIPDLEELCMMGIQFTPTLFEDLCEALVARRRCGLPLSRLVIRDTCGLDAEDEMKLVTLVDDLEFDREPGYDWGIRRI